MQQFTRISGNTLINESPASLMASLDTLLSNSAGVNLPQQSLTPGRTAFVQTTDSGKLFCLSKTSPSRWKLIADLNQTYASMELVDEKYLTKDSIATSLANPSDTTPVATSVVNQIAEDLSTYKSSIEKVVTGLSVSGSKMAASNDFSVSKDNAVLEVRGGKTGTNSKGRASTVSIGSVSDLSFSIVTHGDGVAYMGLGATQPDGSLQTPLLKATKLGGVSFTSEVSTNAAFLSLGNATFYKECLFKSNAHFTGDVVTNSPLATLSDRRTKKEVKVIPHALESILSLRGVQYVSKITNKESLGLIAQEVEAVFPEVVIPTGKYKAVAYQNLIGPIIEAIKELDAKIEAK